MKTLPSVNDTELAFVAKINELVDRIEKVNAENAELKMRILDAELLREHWLKKYEEMVKFLSGRDVPQEPVDKVQS